jgi:hypothetical protein
MSDVTKITRGKHNLNKLDTTIHSELAVTQELTSRLAFATATIWDTVRKLTIPFPSQLKWVYKQDSSEFNFQERSNPVIITDGVTYNIPLECLINDPVAVAQWVRREARKANDQNILGCNQKYDEELRILKETKQESDQYEVLVAAVESRRAEALETFKVKKTSEQSRQAKAQNKAVYLAAQN